MKIFGYEITRAAEIVNAAPQSEARPDEANIRGRIMSEQVLYRTRQDIATWRAALNEAESIQNPNRTQLLTIYKDIMLDAHLSALIETRKQAILSAKFNVLKNGKIKEEHTERLNQKWFYDFASLALDSIFYGHSLISFNSMVDWNFTGVELVPRHYVKQEFDIVVETPGQNTGTNYTESPFKEWFIPVGDKRDLGLLAKAAPLVLWKKGALASWSMFSDGFGVPFRIGKTNARDEKTRREMENMLRNLANASYGVIDIDDVVEILEVKNVDVHQVFERLIAKCDEQLSKLILGQTSTSDQKAYVGSANVHERILHQVNKTDEVFLENIFRYQLVPFLNAHGFALNNMSIEKEPDDELTLKDKFEIDYKLLDHYDIDPKYIEEKYGTPVLARAAQPEPETNTEIKNKLRNYYGE